MIIRHMIGILNKSQKRKLIGLFILMFIGSIIEMLGVSCILPLVDLISNPESINKEKYRIIGDFFSLHTLNQYIIFISVGLIILYVVKNIYLILEYDIQYRYVYDSQRDLTVRMLKCYINEDYTYHVSHNPSESQRNILNDVETAFQAIRSFLQLATEVLVCVILILYLMMTDISITLATFALLMVFMSVFFYFYKKYSYRLGVRVRDTSAEQLKWVNQSLSGIKEIKVSDTEQYFIGKFSEAAQEFSTARRINATLGIISRPVMETVLICGLLVTILFRIFMGADMSSIVPTLSVFAVAAFRMLPSINRITNSYNTMVYGKASIDATYYELQKDEYICGIQNDSNIKFNVNKSGDADINMINISYKYPTGEDNVLENVNICIKANKSTAIIGESGAGKSTLADVLLGVLTPDIGKVTYKTNDIYNNLNWWHKCIGYIPQAIYLMDDTILRNVAFGIEEGNIDESKVWRALKKAQLDEFVKDLPEQLYTKVGDRGVRLSGGQRQRIGIARALYNNPEILIMDEATSALDNETESAVMDAIDEMQGTKTIIIIAHRLSTIKNCDYIYRVVDKNVKEIMKCDIFK